MPARKWWGLKAYIVFGLIVLFSFLWNPSYAYSEITAQDTEKMVSLVGDLKLEKNLEAKIIKNIKIFGCPEKYAWIPEAV